MEEKNKHNVIDFSSFRHKAEAKLKRRQKLLKKIQSSFKLRQVKSNISLWVKFLFILFMLSYALRNCGLGL